MTLDKNLKTPVDLLKRCPACKRNFIDLYCYFTCDPHQSLFMNANKTGPEPRGKDNPITAVNCAISTDFADGMYKSCKDVQMPSGNMRAMSVLCGRKDCSPQHWLDYMGNTSNRQTPFMIYFNLAEKPVHIHGATLYPMERNITSCDKSCSCQDCTTACAAPPPPPPPPPAPWTIWGIDAMAFICSCVYSVFVLIFGTYLIWYVARAAQVWCFGWFKL